MSRYSAAEREEAAANEVFHFLAATFDVALANKMMEETKGKGYDSHGKFIEVSCKSLASFLGFVYVDEDFAMNDDAVDLTKPVIFALIPENPKKKNGPRGPLMIDGYHRAHKAVQLGMESLPAFVLSSYASDKVRIH